MLTWIRDWWARALHHDATPRDIALLQGPGDPRDEAWLDLLLCPARTGFTIASPDIARIARELSVVVVPASPRDGLRTLLARHPAGALRRLAQAAEAQAEARERCAAPEPDRWAARARKTAQLLREQATLFGTQLSLISNAEQENARITSAGRRARP